MLGLQVIQPLTTILVIIRQLEAIKLAASAIRQPHGVVAVMETMFLINMLSIQLIQVELTVPVLQMQILYSINSTTSNGPITTVKQKLAVPLGLKNCPRRVLLLQAIRFMVQLIILHQTANLHLHIPPHGGQNLVHLNWFLLRFEFRFYHVYDWNNFLYKGMYIFKIFFYVLVV